jgi:hypothetical protein
LIGVVDTGLVPGSTHVGVGAQPGGEVDGFLDQCGASHGEFVANVVEAANPKATTISANAFPWRGEGCWASSEDQVLAATALLLAEAETSQRPFDAINFSLGAEPHPVQGVGDLVPPLLLRVTLEELLAEVADDGTVLYAAAGNREPDEKMQIYPAAYPDVIGVGAADPIDRPTVWEDPDEAPIIGFTPASWAALTAPGCDMVAVATADGLDSDEVVVWSGSSFASPVAAAIGAAADVPAGDYTDVLFTTPPESEGSQCQAP